MSTAEEEVLKLLKEIAATVQKLTADVEEIKVTLKGEAARRSMRDQTKSSY